MQLTLSPAIIGKLFLFKTFMENLNLVHSLRPIKDCICSKSCGRAPNWSWRSLLGVAVNPLPSGKVNCNLLGLYSNPIKLEFYGCWK